MATHNQSPLSTNRQSISIHLEQEHSKEEEKVNDDFDYSQRAPWLRAAVLGANDGLVTIAALMIGVGSVRQDIKAMLLTGFAGLVAGACSMAIGEFVSVYAQLDIELAQLKRRREESDQVIKAEKLPKPAQAALASSLAFTVGAMVPLLAAVFIGDFKVRLGVVTGATTAALLVFGAVGAVLGNAPVRKSCLRGLAGGWLAMGITFGLTKLAVLTGL